MKHHEIDSLKKGDIIRSNYMYQEKMCNADYLILKCSHNDFHTLPLDPIKANNGIHIWNASQLSLNYWELLLKSED